MAHRKAGPVLANIFLGKIKSWNDPAIAKLNPDMKLPELPIQVLHRNEGKGSNYILSDYLAKVSPEFLATAGRSESPKWPMGQGFRRSQDLVAKLRGTPGAIGYTESARDILAGSGDFGGWDAPIPETLLRAADRPILELPTVLIGIVII